MKLTLTTDQSAQLTPHLRTGTTIIGRVMREPFDGTNAQTCGTLWLECGSVPTAALPSLREAIRKATAPARKGKP